ncbi:MAG TPA: metallophosphoesterase [Chloroflexi bacterium]|nr:metallophosphoesterase [Chloroflexota bacterium]
MRVLVFSDIHANLTALEAVLADAGPVDAHWFLGDLVGYGPDPNECVARVRSLPNLVAVLGNHDAAVLEKMPLNWFNREARNLIRWTQERLTPENFAFLQQLPEQQPQGKVLLVHGSPRAPVTEYILTAEIAAEALARTEASFCFVGHTHSPAHWQEEDGGVRFCPPVLGEALPLKPRAILNPGSVGQPRDGDPRAAYALYDTEAQTWAWRRVPYDIGAVQQRMRALGLSPTNVLRLAVGR